MILDENGQPFPEKSLGERYVDALARSYRDSLWNLTVHLEDGWTAEQHHHWVETGERPK